MAENKYRDFEICRGGRIVIPKVITGDIGYCLMFGHNPPRDYQRYDVHDPDPIAEYEYGVVRIVSSLDGMETPQILPESNETPGE